MKKCISKNKHKAVIAIYPLNCDSHLLQTLIKPTPNTDTNSIAAIDHSTGYLVGASLSIMLLTSTLMQAIIINFVPRSFQSTESIPVNITGYINASN